MFSYLKRIALVALAARPYSAIISYLRRVLNRAVGVLHLTQDAPSDAKTPSSPDGPPMLPRKELPAVADSDSHETPSEVFDATLIPSQVDMARTSSDPSMPMQDSPFAAWPWLALNAGGQVAGSGLAQGAPIFREPIDEWGEMFDFYRPGGYCPILIGSRLNDGRFEVLHKLGSGGSATVWLALDSLKGGLVALKVLQAERAEIVERELDMTRTIREMASKLEGMRYIRVPISTFEETSPNGVHTCLVQPLAGPSLNRIMSFGLKTPGSGHIRPDLVTVFARQAGKAIKLLHDLQTALHDITPANWAVRLKDEVHMWSKEKVYSVLGQPQTYPFETVNGAPIGPHAPTEEVESVEMCIPAMAPFLEEAIQCIDLGDTVDLSEGPIIRHPTVPTEFQAPEAIVEGRISLASDIWTFALFIFEMLTGDRLFQVSDRYIVSQHERLLGLPPNSLIAGVQLEDRGGRCLPEVEKRLRDVGRHDKRWADGPMTSQVGTGLSEDEIQRWTVILSRMLRLRPEDRPSIDSVLEWLAAELPEL